MAGEPAKKKPYELKFSVLKLTPSFPPPLPVGTSDSGLSGIPADLLHSHASGSSEEWHIVGDSGEPGFTNSWVNFAGGHTTARFKKVHGSVHVAGLIKDGTANQAAFTLPLGYRPVTGTLVFSGQTSLTTVAALRFDIETTGIIRPISAGGAGVWISLGCSFRAD